MIISYNFTPSKEGGTSPKYRIVCLGYEKGTKRPSVIGYNSYNKTHPVSAKADMKYGNTGGNKAYLHAEIDCVLKAQRQGIKLRKIRVFKERLGKLEAILPCVVCQGFLGELGIKVIFE